MAKAVSSSWNAAEVTGRPLLDETRKKFLHISRRKTDESKLGDLLDFIFSETNESKKHTDDKKLRFGISWGLICSNDMSKEARTPNSPLLSYAVDQVSRFLESNNTLFGRNSEVKQLLSQLLAPSVGGHQFTVISIVGIGGIGKTTLARRLFEDKNVEKHFEVNAWVKTAGHDPNDLRGIAREIINSASGLCCPLDDLEELDEMVRDAFLSRRSLIVLDEIESLSRDTWKHMREAWFSTLNLGSKIIVTTCSKQVVDLVSGESLELEELSQDASWSLYSSFAFDSTEVIDNHGLILSARRLAARCRGVPLTLKLLGTFMRSGKWLSELLLVPQEMEKTAYFLDPSFVLCLNMVVLPPHLIRCFAYCSLFPKGCVLNKEKLIKMWIAEGFVCPTSSGMNSLEDIGETYFRQFLSRSFFMDIACNDSGDVIEARMPGAIHEFARKIHATLYKQNVAVAAGINKTSDQIYVDLPSGEVCDTKLMRTLIFTPASSATQGRSFRDFKHLRTLDLSGSGIRALSSHVSVLKELEYLNLSSTSITSLPRAIAELVSLRTLDLSKCYYLKRLPKGIRNLTQLTHLDLSLCNSLYYLPSGIGLLRSLKSLPLFVLGDKEGAGLGELQDLNNLKGNLHIRSLDTVKDIKEAKAARLIHKKIRHLVLSWSHNVDETSKVLEWLKPNSHLQVLELMGYSGYEFPSWMPTLKHLTIISLYNCNCIKLPTLGQMPTLKELLLDGMENVTQIGKEFYGDGDDAFPSLETLRLCGMPKLCRWAAESSHLALKTLTVQGCPQLLRLPSLPSVQDLVLWNSNNEILPSLASFKSLSCLLINDLGVGEFFRGLANLSTLKKLSLINIKDLDGITSDHINRFEGLEHLDVVHCPKLKSVALPSLQSLQKLNIVECENLMHILFSGDKRSSLTELIVDGCQKLPCFGDTTSITSSLRILVIRSCTNLGCLPSKNAMLVALEYLFISGCPLIEEQLQKDQAPISRVPCVILTNRKLQSL